MIRPPPISTLFPYPTLFRSNADEAIAILENRRDITVVFTDIQMPGSMDGLKLARAVRGRWPPIKIVATSGHVDVAETDLDRKSTRLNSSHDQISYAVFCLKK